MADHRRLRRPGLFGWLGDKCDEYWPVLLVATAGVGLVFLRDFVSVVWGKPELSLLNVGTFSVVVIIVVGFVAGNVAIFRRNALAGHLSAENAQLQGLIRGFGDDYFDIWRAKLGHMAKTLNFTDHERISLYRFSEADKKFLMIGRYSEGPAFNETGRGIYPASEGCIAKAWQNGEGIVEDLPDPRGASEEYLDIMRQEWGIDAATVHRFKMKSRSIAAFAIRDRSDLYRIAVIVFESTEPKALPIVALRELVDGHTGREISHLIEILRPLEPSLDLARKGGF